ncbi:MAG: arginase [bacterium]|nr:arginase [bacterium]
MLKIIKAETSLGSDNKGSELAPELLLKSGLLNALDANKINYEILELPKIPQPEDSTLRRLNLPAVKNHTFLTALNKSIYDLAVTSKNKNNKTLLLGGDHSASIGSMFATKKSAPKAVLLYIDAHPDCNSPTSSPSGNMHGMSLSTALGDALYEDYKYPKYKYSEIILLGAKDIDSSEQRYIKDKKIKMYTITDVITDGVGSVMKEILKFIADRPLHVSLDIDSVDVSEAPGTGIINKGGLTYREIRYITELLSTKDIRSIDLMEINPKNDENNKTLNLGTELVINLLGGKWSPYEKYLNAGTSRSNNNSKRNK